MAEEQNTPSPPWSKEAEEAFLGAILLLPAVVDEVADL